MNTPAARRFYKHATVAADGAGIMLDERRLKTPRGAAFAAPTRALAEAMAQEWDAQREHIVPASMPLTQLAFAAIDHTPARREQLAHGLAKYIETDLVAHRAASPAPLVTRQAAAWDPLIAWANERFHMQLPVVTGVAPAEISAQQLTVFEREIDGLDPFRATALSQAITLAGSAVIGFALLEGRLDAASAFAAAALDDLWSLETWGEDAEARARLDTQRTEFETISRFIGHVSA
jgi:chaperone required for assembly of F1-ATPase